MGIRGRLLLLAVGVAVPLALVGVVGLRGMWNASRLQLDDSVGCMPLLGIVLDENVLLLILKDLTILQ
jgi:hypothetical protein